MKKAKGLKNAAFLRTLTSLKPEVLGGIRWEGKSKMFTKFGKMKNAFIAAEENENTTLTLDNVDDRVYQQSVKYFSLIDKTTKFLQTHLLPLYKCSVNVEDLLLAISSGRNRISSQFYGCQLGDNYFKLCHTNRKIHSCKFESGVIKIQRCQNDDVPLHLTREEKSAVKHLLKSRVDGNGGGDLGDELEDEPETLDEVEQARKRRRTQEIIGNTVADDYINLDFILGSAAEVERLWSISSYILLNNRLSISPVMFEALAYLKVNKELWNETDVIEAMSRRQSERVLQAINEDFLHDV